MTRTAYNVGTHLLPAAAGIDRKGANQVQDPLLFLALIDFVSAAGGSVVITPQTRETTSDTWESMTTTFTLTATGNWKFSFKNAKRFIRFSCVVADAQVSIGMVLLGAMSRRYPFVETIDNQYVRVTGHSRAASF